MYETLLAMYPTIYLLAELLIWVLCPLLIGLILLQGGAGDISSAFGGGGQLDSTLGVGASRKMAKVTGWLGLIFMVMVLFLAIPIKGVIKDKKAEDTITQTTMPETPTASTATEASVPSLVTVESSAPALVPPASAADAIPSTTAAAVVPMEAAPSASTATGG